MHEHISLCLRKEVCGVTSYKPTIACLQNYVTPRASFQIEDRGDFFTCIQGLGPAESTRPVNKAAFMIAFGLR